MLAVGLANLLFRFATLYSYFGHRLRGKSLPIDGRGVPRHLFQGRMAGDRHDLMVGATAFS